MPAPPPVVTQPIVVAVAEDDLEYVIASAAAEGAGEAARHTVGQGRTIIEFALTGVGPSEAHGGDRARTVVKLLRAAGLTAIDGPRSAGHAVAWAARNAPVYFGPDACVCMPWSVFDREPVDLVVEIDPGNGFGSGGHPSTLMLLRRLRAIDLAGKRVLDVGSGSGVLTVAAALLGSDSVTALDVAPPAVLATANNAARNSVADRVTLVGADLGSIHERFDLILANIKADVLISMAPDFHRLCALDGVVAVSGFSPAQTSKLVAALAPMIPVWTGESAEWVAVSFGRTS